MFTLENKFNHANLNIVGVADRRLPQSGTCIAADRNFKGRLAIGLDVERGVKRVTIDIGVAEKLEVRILAGSRDRQLIAMNSHWTFEALQNDLERATV